MRAKIHRTRRSLWFMALTLSLGAVACSAQNEASLSGLPPGRAADSYAIYSLVIPGDVLARMDPVLTQRWAIAATTINAQDINPALAPEAALKPPKTGSKEFAEAVADYHARKNQRFLLAPDFQLDRPYILLSPAEVAEFRAVRSGPHTSSALRQKYSAYPGITYLSQVYFNSSQTAALVYRLDWCGNLCAQAEWVYLEKQNGHWVRRSGSTKG